MLEIAENSDGAAARIAVTANNCNCTWGGPKPRCLLWSQAPYEKLPTDSPQRPSELITRRPPAHEKMFISVPEAFLVSTELLLHAATAIRQS